MEGILAVMSLRLDHLVVVDGSSRFTPELAQDVLGRGPDWQTTLDADVLLQCFQFSGGGLEILSPTGDSELSVKLRRMATESRDGFTSLAFSSEDLGSLHQRMTQNALHPSEIMQSESSDERTGRIRKWKRFRLPDNEACDLKTFYLSMESEHRLSAPEIPPDCPHRLVGLQIKSAHVNCLEKLFGEVLNLKPTAKGFQLDDIDLKINSSQSSPTQLVEESRSLDTTISGITLGVRDIDACRERMKRAGLRVSDHTASMSGTKEPEFAVEGLLGDAEIRITHSAH